MAAGPTEQINEATRRTGANSAFFDDRIDNNKEWLIRGSRSGLQRFAQLICEHVGRRAGDRFGSNIRSRACAVPDHDRKSARSVNSWATTRANLSMPLPGAKAAMNVMARRG